MRNFTMKLARHQFNLKCNSCGYGLTEYIVIVALIAVVAFSVYRPFVASIRNLASGVTMEVAGIGRSAAPPKTDTTAGTAETLAKDSTKGTLSTYVEKAGAGKK